MPPDLSAGIGAYRADDKALKSESEAIRAIIRDWLIGHGYLPLE